MDTLRVPVEAERVLKQAALNCAEMYFEDDSREALKQGLPILAAVMAEFSTSTRAKKPKTMISETLRAGVTFHNASQEGRDLEI